MPSGAPIDIPIRGIDQYTQEFRNALNTAGKFGKQLEKVGQTMTLGLTVPIVGLGVASTVMSRELNKSMAQVGTLIPKQTEELKRFRKEVIGIGKDTATEFEVVAEGLYETISAFGSAEDPINKLDLSARMAKAGASSVKEALDLLSVVTKGYGDTSDETAKSVADMSFFTVKLGKTTFPELAASMGNVTPLASTLKVPMTELFGAMATLTGVTGDASEVSTQLASALGGIIRPSATMTKAAKQLGFESSIAMLKEWGLARSLKELNVVAKGSELELGKLFHRKEGLNAVLTLLGPQAKNFAEKTKAMGKAAGATDKAFKAITEGIDASGFSWDQLVIKVKAFMIQIGDKLLPVLSRLFDRFEPYAQKLFALSDYHFDLGIKIAGVVAVIGPMIWIVGKAITTITSLVTAIAGVGGLTGVLASLTGPVGIGIALIGGIIAIMTYCRKETQALKQAIAGPFIAIWKELKEIFKGTSDTGNDLSDTLKSITAVVSPLLAPVAKLLTMLLLFPLKAWVTMMKVAVPVVDFLSSGLKVLGNFLKIGFDKLVDFKNELKESTGIGKIFGEAMEWVGEVLENAYGWVKYLLGGFSDLTGFLKGLGEEQDKEFEAKGRKKRGVKNKQEWLKANSNMSYPSPLDFSMDEQFLQEMRQSKESESSIKITFDNLPEGVRPIVEKAKGGKVEIDDRKGEVMPALPI